MCIKYGIYFGLNWIKFTSEWNKSICNDCEKKMKRYTQICGSLHWFTNIIALFVAKMKWQKQNITFWPKWILTLKTEINNRQKTKNCYGACFSHHLPFAICHDPAKIIIGWKPMPAMKLNQSHTHGKLMFFFRIRVNSNTIILCKREEREKNGKYPHYWKLSINNTYLHRL